MTEQSIRLWKEFSGRLFPVDYVEIRPQVSGLITEVKFEDGQLVNKGDVLYIIDPRILKAIVAQKKADLITAKNRYSFADKEHKRVIDLVKKKMVPQQVIDEYLNTKLIADSSVNHAKAELAEAEINLSYAYIKAPISGRVSRTELTEGNLVSAGIQAPILTSIVANKSIYADFEVDEHTYLRYTNGLSTVDAGKQKNPVELRLQAGDHVYKGEIHAFDNMIDPASGTIRARARFDNSQGKLLAGMYARLKLGSITEEKVILISELAIGTDQDRKFVYIVNDDNKTVYRQIQVSDSIKGDRIVSSGLEAGDKVILGGLMRIRPDMPVEPTITTNSGDF
ncbi:MAG: efflux RND transporter periplasmic adaptor subunit [Piscirickettsiaceae bacterium]|nr:efflux RND transporter periplasmic adaptor subunit [Piscirickettsiaceae bacterium]